MLNYACDILIIFYIADNEKAIYFMALVEQQFRLLFPVRIYYGATTTKGTASIKWCQVVAYYASVREV